MSFQDVGKSSRRSGTASASMQSNTSPFSQQPSSIPETSTWSSGFSSIASVASSVVPSSSNPSIGQISESLTQYQRNVGILEKIGQSLQQQSTAGRARSSSSSSNTASAAELEQQYRVQLDVLRQLEKRVRDQFQTQKKQHGSSNNTALIKLERDFERVQATAQSCRAKVTKLQKQQQQRNAAVANQTAATNAFQQEQKQFQLQIQEDKLHEEMMREREQEIRNINKGMHQVNEIYKDLAHIVGTQQEQVDQIEGQMEHAKTNAESGLEQVQKANDKYGQSQCVIS